MKKSIILIIIAASFVIAGLSIFVTRMNTLTEYNQLVDNYDAMRVKEAAFHDELWKTISQTAQVDVKNDEMQNRLFQAWENAISKTATSSVSTGQGIMPILFQQTGISLDTSVKNKLVQIIDDKHSEFTLRRNDIAAACLELNKFVSNEWNRMFLPDHAKKVDCKIITSTRTQNASETGRDDESKLY